jgi:hypothetical protein
VRRCRHATGCVRKRGHYGLHIDRQGGLFDANSYGVRINPVPYRRWTPGVGWHS